MATVGPGRPLSRIALTPVSARPDSTATPSDANPLVWEFDFKDDGVGNKRLTGAMRDVGVAYHAKARAFKYHGNRPRHINGVQTVHQRA